MYWLRSVDLLNLVLFGLLCLGWSLGGWLLVVHAFRLRSSERLLVGVTTGLLLFITLSNLLSNLPASWLPLTGAYWLGGLLVLLAGILVAVRRPQGRSFFPLRDLRHWPQLAALVALTLFFTLIGRGLGLFDDYLHLPLVSVMAAGDILPRFYLNPDLHFAYHYGLQVLAASLVRMAGFFPWSAWDAAKAPAIALTLVLAWLWVRRQTKLVSPGSQLATHLGSFLITFAGGARWLLLLVPLGLLARAANLVELPADAVGQGTSLLSALSGPWLADGSGPYAFPFAFHNGIFVPAMFSLSASGALPFVAVLLLLLLAPRRRLNVPAVVVLSLVLANLALTGEHLFVFLWAGIALAGLLYLFWPRRAAGGRTPSFAQRLRDPQVWGWAAILFISGLVSVVQGAFLTEAMRNILLRLQGVSSGTGGSYDYFSFTPRWPPAMISAHFGALSLLNPYQLLVLLAELGPMLLFGPVVTASILRRIRRRDWLWAGLALAALFSILIATFFRYGVERSSTRLPAAALWIWAVLGFPWLWNHWPRLGRLPRLGWQAAYAVAVTGGVVILAISMLTLTSPQLSYYQDGNDASLSRQLWDQLPDGTQVFDIEPYRAVAVFGRPARTSLDFYHPLPGWEALEADPRPAAVAVAGFDFIYIDQIWWRRLSAEQKQALQDPCVQVFASAAEGKPGSQKLQGQEFRWLLDVRNCAP